MANVCECGEPGEDETLVHRAEDGGWVVAKEGREVMTKRWVRFHEGTEGEEIELRVYECLCVFQDDRRCVVACTETKEWLASF